MRHVVLSVVICLALASETLAQANTGTIKGHVRLSGKLPGNPFIRMGMDPMCSKMNAGKRILQEYVVATVDGSLANVFVRLQGNVPQTPVSTEPVVIDQRGCVYMPRVVGVRAGQVVQIKNSDALLHNVTACPARTTASTSDNQRRASSTNGKRKTKRSCFISSAI